METAEEFLRQAVKNSSVENTDKSVTNDKTVSATLTCISQTENKLESADCDNSKDNAKDLSSGNTPSTSETGAASSEKNDAVVNDAKPCVIETSTETCNIGLDLASPEKRGVKR